MTPIRVVSALAVLAVLLSAQITSAPPICFSFNNPTTAGPLGNAYATYYGSLHVHFTCPTTATIDRIDLWTPAVCVFCNAPMSFDLHLTAGLGVPPSGPSLATYQGSLAFFDNWKPFQPFATGPASLSAGATYAISIRGYPAVQNQSQYGLVCMPISHDTTGANQLLYQFAGYGACPPTPFPASGTLGLMLRFRGASCGPGPLASVASVGGPCGVPPCGSPPCPPTPTLSSNTPPVLGSAWPANLGGPANETAMLFWSGGGNPGGAPIVAGSSCLVYLDLASVAALAALGAEPLVTGVLTPSTINPAVGSLGLVFQVPSNPIYAGLVVGVQVAIVGPTGTIALGGGVFCQTTNALQLTLGY